MKVQDIEIGNKKYKVLIAESEEDKSRGLRGVKKLPKGKGMLFVWDSPQKVSMTMQDTPIPLHQIFIDEDGEIIKEAIREDINQDVLISCEDTKWVLEINPDNTIQEGDYVEGLVEEDKESKTPIMKVLSPDGSTQMELQGGERIVSRRETVVLIRKAKKANSLKTDPSKYDKACKNLGKYMFKVLKGQDSRDPEYVQAPK